MTHDIDPQAFRQLMGRFVTGVTVVTTTSPNGDPVGMTASSLTSVSLEPPLISVCVNHQSDMHTALRQADGFVVNILASGQEPLSRRFAEDHEDRFVGVPHHPGRLGHPVLEGCIASLECRPHGAVDAGDHTVFLGEVVGGTTADGQPLVYYRGEYTSLDDS